MSFSMWLALSSAVAVLLVVAQMLPNVGIATYLLLFAVFVELREQRRVS